MARNLRLWQELTQGWKRHKQNLATYHICDISEVKIFLESKMVPFKGHLDRVWSSEGPGAVLHQEVDVGTSNEDTLSHVR